MRGVSQEQLAEKSKVGRSHISAIEALGLVRPFSLEVFFNIADALEVDPADLINATVFPDKIIKNNLLNKSSLPKRQRAFSYLKLLRLFGNDQSSNNVCQNPTPHKKSS